MKLLYLVLVVGFAALTFGDDSQDNSMSPMQQLEDTIMMENEEKRAWRDLTKSWGKRGWSDLQSGWGKRAWGSLHSSGWGKRGWADLQSAGWGKRSHPQQVDEMEMDKKSWDSLHGGWGKRAADWGSFRGSWGKRDPAWQNLKGLWGKRSFPHSESFEPGLNNLEEEMRRGL